MSQYNHSKRQRSVSEYVVLCQQWGEFLHYTIDKHGVLIVDSDGIHAQALRARLATENRPFPQKEGRPNVLFKEMKKNR